jgi:sulfur-carrier protein adenylyltransferase/sulfurtransferase
MEKSFIFSNQELARYNRHIIIPDFGLESQQKLRDAKVLVIGAGGLGSPLLLYLAAAGIGTLGIVDFDVVEDSNLQRQVLYDSGDVGKPKAEAAKTKINMLNGFIDVVVYDTALDSENAIDIISMYDVVADGTDNFATRYLVNDACVLLGKPNVYASIFQFDGQLSVFNYRKNEAADVGPNYRDLFAAPPPADLVPSCAVGGVLGVLPGILGSMQALEVIKIVTGVGEVLSGRLFTFDALNFQTNFFQLKPDPHNPLRTSESKKTLFSKGGDQCNVRKTFVKQISAEELLHMMDRGEDFQLIDVREPDEFNEDNLGGKLIPLGEIIKNHQEISIMKKVVVHCKMGSRSEKAIRLLEAQFGYLNLYNLTGGIIACRQITLVQH